MARDMTWSGEGDLSFIHPPLIDFHLKGVQPGKPAPSCSKEDQDNPGLGLILVSISWPTDEKFSAEQLKLS